LAGIPAHGKWGVTHALIQRLNSLFGAVERKARGFSTSDPTLASFLAQAGGVRN